MRPPIPARLVVLALALLLAPRALAAQGDSTRLAPGTRALLVTGGRFAERRYIGRVLAADGAAITLVGERGDTMVVPAGRIRQAYRSMGAPHGSRAGTGALAGMVAGAMVGAAVGQNCASSGSFVCFDRSETVPVGMAGGALIGLFVGSLTGRERWQPVRLAPRVTLAPAGGAGPVPALTLHF